MLNSNYIFARDRFLR